MIRAYINATTKAVTRAVIPWSMSNLNYTDKVNIYFGDTLVCHWPLQETEGVLAKVNAPIPSVNNFMPNPGFKANSSNLLAIVGTTVDRTEADGEFHTGGGAAKITASSGLGITSTIDLSVIPGKKYKIKFWCRGDGLNSLSYSVVRGSGVGYYVPITDTGINGTGWVEIESPEFTAIDGYYLTKIRFIVPVPGVCYVDDLEMFTTEPLTTDYLQGIYGKATLNQPGFGNEKSVYFDGTSGSGVRLSTMINNIFPKTGGTLISWFKIDPNSFGDGISRWSMKFKTNKDSEISNYIDIFKSPSYGYGIQYRDSADVPVIEKLDPNPSGWVCVICTWGNGIFNFYSNGILIATHTDVTGVFNYEMGGGISAIGSGIYELDGNNWHGWLSHHVLGSEPLSESAIKALSKP